MQFEKYIEKRRPLWDELELLLRRAGGSGRNLAPAEIERLGSLYRQTASHYTLIEQSGFDPELAHGLKTLIVRAASIIYPSDTTSKRKKVFDAVMNALPACFQRNIAFFYVSAAIFLVAFIIGYVSVTKDPDIAYSIVSGNMYGQADVTRLLYSEDARRELLTHGRGQTMDAYSVFATYLFFNNTKVGLLSFASGILAAVPTVFLHMYNGLGLGAFAGIFNQGGIDPDFWGWILPHGIPEIFAILICGMAGLMLGGAIIHPGRFDRRYLIRRRGKEVAILVIGTFPLFLLAAFIEGFFRQSGVSTYFRLIVAVAVALLIGLYFGMPRHRGR